MQINSHKMKYWICLRGRERRRRLAVYWQVNNSNKQLLYCIVAYVRKCVSLAVVVEHDSTSTHTHAHTEKHTHTLTLTNAYK